MPGVAMPSEREDEPSTPNEDSILPRTIRIDCSSASEPSEMDVPYGPRESRLDVAAADLEGDPGAIGRSDRLEGRRGNRLTRSAALTRQARRRMAKRLCSKPARQFALEPGVDWVKRLSAEPALEWALMGESSVTRYATFSQSGPRRVVVSGPESCTDIARRQNRSRRQNFADLELVESEERGFFYANETDKNGVRWASRLQTWLELQSGDGRQQQAARDVRAQLLKGIQ